jgi:PAS domain S-box-containing protein
MTGVSEPLIQASLLGEAIEHGPAAVFLADEHGAYVAVNQAACSMLGYTREELLGLRVADVDRSREANEEPSELRQPGTSTGTSTLTCKDGSTVEFAYVGGITRVAGMPLYVSIGAAV